MHVTEPAVPVGGEPVTTPVVLLIEIQGGQVPASSAKVEVGIAVTECVKEVPATASMASEVVNVAAPPAGGAEITLIVNVWEASGATPFLAVTTHASDGGDVASGVPESIPLESKSSHTGQAPLLKVGVGAPVAITANELF